jgi:hypothetical protein
MNNGAVNDDGKPIVLRRGTGLKPGVFDAPLTRPWGLTPAPPRKKRIDAVNGWSCSADTVLMTKVVKTTIPGVCFIFLSHVWGAVQTAEK